MGYDCPIDPHFAPDRWQAELTLALPVQGKKDNLNRFVWRRFAEYCGLPEKTALRILNRQAAIAEKAIRLIDRSFLPDDQKQDFKRLIVDRTHSISADNS
jgi:hypothetical protein